MIETTRPIVLVVDDVSVNLLYAKMVFAELEVTLVVAEGGQEALAACEAQAFDLILMDIRMPGLDGIETTRRIRQLANANARAPVVALTTDANFKDPVIWRAAGMDGYLARPFYEDDIRRLLARWGY